MIRYECFEWLAPLMTDQLVVTSLSGQRVEMGPLVQPGRRPAARIHGQRLGGRIGISPGAPAPQGFCF